MSNFLMSTSGKNNLLPQTEVHVDLDAIAHNVRALKQRCTSGTELMAVVKANAYGHGAVTVARTALANGASFLGVARISEAVELREAGIDAPILLFGDVRPCQVSWLASRDVRVSLSSLESARVISRAILDGDGSSLDREKSILDSGNSTLDRGKPILDSGSSTLDSTSSTLGSHQPLKVHIKVDTGMGRLGFIPELPCFNSELKSTVDEIMAVMALDGLETEGIYTHFANADAKDKTHANEQLDIFNALLDALESHNAKPRICHTANSAAVIEIPRAHFNMVRPGIALYGLWPSDEIDHSLIDLKPAMSITSKIIHLKSVPPSFKVSYGSTHITRHPTKIATLPIGYADGYSRLLSSKGHMLVRGIKAPIAGRVCMDFTMIDVGHIPGVVPGDDIVIMGRQDDEEITADEIAGHTGTINYEVVAALTGRMPVRYCGLVRSQT